MAVEKIALLQLPALAKLIYEMGFKTADMVHDHLGLKYMGKDAARDFLFCVAVILREWINVQACNSPVLGIMVDESTESKDCDDDDAEVIGAFSSDEEADGEDSEKGAADDADDESAGEVSLSAETVDLLKSHGKCKSIRRGWKIVPKDEAAELIQAVDGKRKQRPWKLVHLWDQYGWREGTVLRRFPSTHSLKLPFQCRYPGAFPIGGVAAHGLNLDQYGGGGLTNDHHEIWVLIKKK